MKKLIWSLLIFLICINVKADDSLATNAKSAILIEASTGNIIYEKNSHEKLHPASMTNIMTTWCWIVNILKFIIDILYCLFIYKLKKSNLQKISKIKVL